MPLINKPPQSPVDQNGSAVSPGWANFFTAVFMLLSGLTTSGSDDQRPTKNLWVGRPFFDTTLGFNIYYNGTEWVDYAGLPA